MKKLLATILAVVYLSSSMGATLHLHYCMGKLISWGLVNHETKNCSNCGMLKSGMAAHSVNANEGCCKDEHKQIKSDQDQKLSQNTVEFSKITDAVPPHAAFHSYSFHLSQAVEYPTANAPPLIARESIFLFNCNFRI